MKPKRAKKVEKKSFASSLPHKPIPPVRKGRNDRRVKPLTQFDLRPFRKGRRVNVDMNNDAILDLEAELGRQFLDGQQEMDTVSMHQFEKDLQDVGVKVVSEETDFMPEVPWKHAGFPSEEVRSIKGRIDFRLIQLANVVDSALSHLRTVTARACDLWGIV